MKENFTTKFSYISLNKASFWCQDLGNAWNNGVNDECHSIYSPVRYWSKVFQEASYKNHPRMRATINWILIWI